MHSEQWLFLKSACYQWLNKLFRHDPGSKPRILVVKMDEIGDMANALHVFPLLKQRFPDARIEVLCKPMNMALLRSFQEVNQVHTNPAILREVFDYRIDLRGTEESLRAAMSQRKAVYLGRGLVRIKNKAFGGQVHEVITNRQIIAPLWMMRTIPDLMPAFRYAETEMNNVDSWLREHDLEKYAVMHTGARDQARRWPAARFAALANHLSTKYGLHVLIGGGPEEHTAVEELIQAHQIKAINLCGIFGLNEFAYLCSQAKIFIGNESGPMHLSWISGCPTLALFGPGVPHIFYPIGDQHRVIHHFQGHQPGNPESMLKIQTEEVLRTVDSMLSAASSA